MFGRRYLAVVAVLTLLLGLLAGCTPALVEEEVQSIIIYSGRSESLVDPLIQQFSNATGIDAVEFARKVVELGAGELLVTSMDRDGTKSGYNIALTRAIADAVPVPVIASGGVGNLDHMVEGIRDGHATAVLAASIFHFGEYTIQEAKHYMNDAGVPMRLDA